MSIKMKFTKINLPTPNRLMIGLMLLIVGVALGIGMTTVPILSNFTLPKLAFLANKISQRPPQQAITIDVSAGKKQKLESFYNEIAKAQEKQDWSRIYDLTPQSLKK